MAQCSLLPMLGTDEDVDVPDIHLCAASRSSESGPAGGGPTLAPTPAKDPTPLRRVVPLVSDHHPPATMGGQHTRIY